MSYQGHRATEWASCARLEQYETRTGQGLINAVSVTNLRKFIPRNIHIGAVRVSLDYREVLHVKGAYQTWPRRDGKDFRVVTLESFFLPCDSIHSVDGSHQTKKVIRTVRNKRYGVPSKVEAISPEGW